MTSITCSMDNECGDSGLGVTAGETVARQYLTVALTALEACVTPDNGVRRAWGAVEAAVASVVRGVQREDDGDRDGDDSSEQGEPRYLVSEGWGHLFGPGNNETTVRFVFDREVHRIIMMEYQERGQWRRATAFDIADVQDSLLNANGEALDKPGEYDCSNSHDLPEWAKAANPSDTSGA